MRIIEPQFIAYRNRSSETMLQNARMLELKDRFAKALEHAHTDVKQMAKLDSVTKVIGYQGLKKILDGKTKDLQAPTCVFLAKFLGVRIEWLATGEGEMLAADEPKTVEVWPFLLLDRVRYERLPPDDRAFIQTVAMETLKDKERALSGKARSRTGAKATS